MKSDFKASLGDQRPSRFTTAPVRSALRPDRNQAAFGTIKAICKQLTLALLFLKFRSIQIHHTNRVDKKALLNGHNKCFLKVNIQKKNSHLEEVSKLCEHARCGRRRRGSNAQRAVNVTNARVVLNLATKALATTSQEFVYRRSYWQLRLSCFHANHADLD